MDLAKAKTFWVWTDKAEKDNPQRSKAGDPIWPHYFHEAPQQWLEDRLIMDSSEFVKEGQVTIFDLMG